jgi:hypothetical protein
MKRMNILLVVIFNVNFFSISQTCLPDGIILTTQKQIDNFQTDYPGCAEIESDVTIQGAGITNLDGLSKLTALKGNFDIRYCCNLQSLTGLESLTCVSGTLSILFNDDLTDLKGLNNLSCLGGLFVFANHSINTLEGIEKINSIGNLEIGFNKRLSSLKGLQNIETVNGNLFIYENGSLLNLTGLDNLKSVGGSAYVWSNVKLRNFQGLNNITSVRKTLSVEFCDVLVSISELGSLNSIGNLNIRYNPLLRNLSGLEKITSVENITFQGNKSLTSLVGLNNLNTISGNLKFGETQSFPTGVVCNSAPPLKNFNGLNNVKTIDGDLIIIGGKSLKNLEGFDSLYAILGSLIVGNRQCKNPVLESLSGLDNLNFIGENLEISNNKSLTSISGLKNVLVIGGNIEIVNNELLDYCAVQSICKNISLHTGDNTIEQNSTGCNSPEEIEEACIGRELFDISAINGIIRIYPNPFNAEIVLEYELVLPKTVSLNIYNQMGKLVYQVQENQQPGSQKLIGYGNRLADGVYFYRFYVGDQLTQGKLLKMNSGNSN